MNRFTADTPPPKTNYKTVPSPYPSAGDSSEIYNSQFCVCGHDRCNHSDYLGHGKKRVFILGVAYAGHCSDPSCDCERFVFSNVKTGEHGKQRRAKEKKLKGVVPPEAQVKRSE